MTVHQYDIVLDVTVTNRTADTLQNLNLELATMGDLKLVERPQNYALRPHGQQSIRCAAGGRSARMTRGDDAQTPAHGAVGKIVRYGRLLVPTW